MTETMNKKDFADAVRARVADFLGEDYEVAFQPVLKNNGTERLGIIVRRNGDSIAPTIYIDEHYHDTDEPVEDYIDSVAEAVVRTYKQSRPGVRFDLDSLQDYAKAREHICMKLVNAEKNAERLENIPHRNFLDLAVTFFIPVDMGDDSQGSASAQVTVQMMEAWGVSVDELYQAALENTPAIFPAKTQVLGDMLSGLMGEPVEIPEGGPKLYVATNEKSMNGATVALYPGYPKAVGEKLGSDFYILPSSIHELLFLPDDGETDASTLKGMVTEINATTVSEEEVLSDNVYHYSREADEVTIA